MAIPHANAPFWEAACWWTQLIEFIEYNQENRLVLRPRLVRIVRHEALPLYYRRVQSADGRLGGWRGHPQGGLLRELLPVRQLAYRRCRAGCGRGPRERRAHGAADADPA